MFQYLGQNVKWLRKMTLVFALIYPVIKPINTTSDFMRRFEKPLPVSQSHRDLSPTGKLREGLPSIKPFNLLLLG